MVTIRLIPSLFASILILHAEPITSPLLEGPAPVDNPLKGLVPYATPAKDRFPHSMEFFYIPMSDVVKAPGEYDWLALEKRLNDIASRGNQAIFRFYLEYPGKNSGIPEHLIQGGLKVHRYTNTNTAPFPPTEVITPNYEDPNLRKELTDFIAAFGKRYDGDPRIGFITAGLLGTWGEWHTHPRNELFASKAVQREVMDTYEKSFRTTPILLRYPVGEKNEQKAENAARPFGYHDDSFAWATLDTGRKQDDWFFIPSLKTAGPTAMDRWKTHPIGGEIRPEAWGVVFDPSPPSPVQSFDRCVTETHVSWLMDTGMFREKAKPERHARALEAVRRMGYEFRVTSVTLDGDSLEITLVNQGIAPFYHPWPACIGILDPSGNNPLKEIPISNRLTEVLPGESAVWRIQLPSPVPPEPVILLQVPNPLKNGKPVRFANRTQDAHRSGWLTLIGKPIPAGK
jgi:hypothetical protein